jgi:hypothetical protein
VEHLGPLLICFGDIEMVTGYGDRIPPETDEQRKAKLLLEMRRAERAKTQDPNKGDKNLKKALTMDENERK